MDPIVQDIRFTEGSQILSPLSLTRLACLHAVFVQLNALSTEHICPGSIRLQGFVELIISLYTF